MKVYLAAGFSRKNEIAEKSQELENMGIKVVSTWPYEEVGPETKMHEVSDDYLRIKARKDLGEITLADTLILFTQDPQKPFCRGGRMHEAGFAHALGKQIIVCGPKENLFHYLPEIYQFDTWEQLKQLLSVKTLV